MTDLRSLLSGAAPEPSLPFDEEDIARRRTGRIRRRAGAAGLAVALVAGAVGAGTLAGRERHDIVDVATGSSTAADEVLEAETGVPAVDDEPLPVPDPTQSTTTTVSPPAPSPQPGESPAPPGPPPGAVACTMTEVAVGGAPGHAAPGRGGSIWFVDATAGSVGRLDPNGKTQSVRLAADARPRAVAVDAGGTAWVTDSGRSSIWRVTPDLAAEEFPTPTRESNPMGVPGMGSHPVDITVGPDGNLWFTASFGDFVGRVTPDGRITEYPLADRDRVHANPWAIATGADGGIWIAAQLTGDLRRLDPATGSMRSVPVDGGLVGGGTDMVAGPDGRLWVNGQGGSVLAVTTAGGTATYPAFAGDASVSSLLAVEGDVWAADERGGRLARVRARDGQVGPVAVAGPPERRRAGADGVSRPHLVAAGESLWLTLPAAGAAGRLSC